MSPSYHKPGLTLAEGCQDPARVRDLQRDLRRLGYLPGGIDGIFGPETARAVRALQLDLIGGGPSWHDGGAAFPITDANRDAEGRPLVTVATGILDQPLACCIATLLADPRAGWLPESEDPAAANRAALTRLRAARGLPAPVPFVLAMLLQDSGCRHYRLPSGQDEDRFLTIGLDRNDPIEKTRITSRRYGLGQHRLTHHPARQEDIDAFVQDPEANVRDTFTRLRDKFDRFVAGPADSAADRHAEHPMRPLRLCRYAPEDPRHMRGCRSCAEGAPQRPVRHGMPAYEGSMIAYQPTRLHPSASYEGVPDRAAFGCDWPYAVRRYCGSGIDSYHYQAIVLRNLLAGAGGTED